jgi:Archaea-specific editing domain of threonyl-tRNA synthetase.
MKSIFVIMMKLLMFDTNDFWYKTFSKTVETAETCNREESATDSLVIFVNVEKEDEAQKNKVVRKAVNNINWLAKKTDRNKVVLHSFGHLSESKSSIEFAENILKTIKEKLAEKGLETSMTPFGYLLEFKIHVKGESLAKVWKSI